MQSLKYCQVPLYLQGGYFYRALNGDDPDATFEVPCNCYRNDDEYIQSIQDFENMLDVIVFWVLDSFPLCVLEFCHLMPFRLWGPSLANRERRFMVLKELFQHKRNDFSLQAAIKSERQEYIDFWFVQNHCDSVFSKNAIVDASAYGRLDLVHALHNRGYPWNSNAFCKAAQHGYLHVLEYLHDNGCPLDCNGVVSAARGGELLCMKYLLSIGCTWNPSAVLQYPIYKSNWYRRTRYQALSDDDYHFYCNQAYGKCLQFALENGHSIHKDTCKKVVQYDLLECLLLLNQYGTSWDKTTTSLAAEFGSLNCLRFLHEHGCPWDEQTTKQAARWGRVDCLRYAMEQGCPYFSIILTSAAAAETPACLQYLIDDCGLYMSANGTILEAAFSAGRYQNMQYLLDVGCPTLNVKFGYHDISSGGFTDSGLVKCMEIALGRGLKVSQKLFRSVTKWDEIDQIFVFPLCNEFVQRENIL